MNNNAKSKLFIMATRQRHAALDTTAINDPNLSFKAKGLHTFIRTRQAGEIVGMPDLIEAGKDKKESVRSGVKELITRKYLHLIQLRDEQGRLSSAVYVSTPIPLNIEPDILRTFVTENKGFLPYPDFPHTGNPYHGDNFGSPPLKNPPPDLKNNNNILHKSTNVDLHNINTNYYFLNSKSAISAPKLPNSKVEEIFDYWNSFKPLPNHRKSERFKTYRTINKLIEKTLRKCSQEKIKEAIKNYAWLLEQPYTTLRTKTNPYRIGLDEFFKFNSYNQELCEKPNHPLQHVDNWFLECKRGKEYLLATYSKKIKDDNPIITTELKKAIIISPLFKHTSDDDFINQDMATLVKTSAYIKTFMNKYGDNFFRRLTISVCVDYLLEYLENVNQSRLHIGYLASDLTWREFKNYLEESGAMEKIVEHGRRVL